MAFSLSSSHIVAEIHATLDAIAAADAEIDNRVLDVHGITDPADRRRILGRTPVTEDRIVASWQQVMAHHVLVCYYLGGNRPKAHRSD